VPRCPGSHDVPPRQYAPRLRPALRGPRPIPHRPTPRVMFRIALPSDELLDQAEGAERRVGARPTRRGSGHSRWRTCRGNRCWLSLGKARQAVEHRPPVQAGHPARVGPTGAPMTETPATQSGAASPYVSADTGHVLLLQRAINDLDDGEELTGGRRVDSCRASTSRRARRRPSAPSASERGMRRERTPRLLRSPLSSRRRQRVTCLGPRLPWRRLTSGQLRGDDRALHPAPDRPIGGTVVLWREGV
jgi:hypothetical protein